MTTRSFVLYSPHQGTTQWFQGLLSLLMELGSDLDPLGLWYPPEEDSVPEDQRAALESVFAGFGGVRGACQGVVSPYRTVIVRYAKAGIELAIVGATYVGITWRTIGFETWHTAHQSISNKDITFTANTETGKLHIDSSSGSKATITLASNKRCSFSVAPVNVTRTITGLREELILAPGVKEVSYYGGIGVHTVTVSASGYSDIEASVDVEAPNHSFSLTPLGEETRIVHLTADRENATVDVSGLTIALPAYVSIPEGDVELTAKAGDHIVTDIVPADATFWQFSFGGGLPNDDIPPPVDPANMTVRVVSLVDGTVAYDNDGFLNDPDPVELGNGFVDIEIPPPAIGCTGGVISLTVPSYGDFQARIRFIAGGTALVHLGPMRVTVQADGPFEVYFDEFSPLTWLPGDGVAKGVGSADRDVSFLTGVGGYVNVIPQGTSKVIRTPVDFAPARECLLDLELALAPGDTPGPGLPFSLEGALPGAVAGAITGAVTGILTSSFR